MAAYLGYDFVDAAYVIRFDENGNLDAEETDKLLSKKRLAECREMRLFRDFTVQRQMAQSRHFPEVVLM